MRRLAGALVILAIAAVLSGSGAGTSSATWTLPAGNLAGTRAAAGSALSADNVSGLKVSWQFAPTDTPDPYGLFASTPLIDGDTVYIEDLRSNVFALDRESGRVR